MLQLMVRLVSCSLWLVCHTVAIGALSMMAVVVVSGGGGGGRWWQVVG